MEHSLSDLIVEAAQILKQHNAERYAGVVRWMLAQEQDTRKAWRGRKKKQVLYTERGEKIELYQDRVRELEERDVIYK